MNRTLRDAATQNLFAVLVGLAIFLLAAPESHAQDLGNCPAGMHTVFDNGRPSCAYDSNYSSGDERPYRTAEQLGYVYGAIAVAPNGHPAWTYANATPKVADAGALKLCNKQRKQKKVEGKCTVAFRWAGGYASLATGNAPVNYFGQGDDPAAAESNALRECGKQRNDCQVWFTVSSRRSEAPLQYELDFNSK